MPLALIVTSVLVEISAEALSKIVELEPLVTSAVLVCFTDELKFGVRAVIVFRRDGFVHG